MIRLLLSLALLLAATPVTAQETVQQHYELMGKAAAAKDWPTMLTHAEAVARLLPRSTRVQYNLACALARNGRPGDAIGVLDGLASRGVYFDTSKDEDLASLRTDERFVKVEARFAELLKPLGHAREAFRLKDMGLLTEGIAHDPASGDFFVGSVHQGRILRVGKDGAARDFVTDKDAVLGLAVDAGRKRLWACTSAMPERTGFDKARENQAALVAFDLQTGAEKARLPLTGEGRHNCNDVTVAADGTVFVSDAGANVVLTASPGATALRVLVPVGTLNNPQGLALSADGTSLFVADYLAGVARVDVASGTSVLLASPEGAALGGIDGLVRHGDRLVAIQNGIRPHRVISLRLDGDRVATVDVLERSHPAFDEPTLGVVSGNELYFVANSQWGSFADGKVAAEKLREPVVLRLALP